MTGEELKEWRKRYNISREELASIVHLSLSWINHLETQKGQITKKTEARINAISWFFLWERQFEKRLSEMITNPVLQFEHTVSKPRYSRKYSFEEKFYSNNDYEILEKTNVLYTDQDAGRLNETEACIIRTFKRICDLLIDITDVSNYNSQKSLLSYYEVVEQNLEAIKKYHDGSKENLFEDADLFDDDNP